MESTEDLDDRTKMNICLQEVSLIILFSCTIFMPQVTGDLVEYGEVESGSTVQGCMCQGFLANRRTLEDASKLFCSNNGNRRNRRSLNYNGFMSHSGLQGAFSSKHSYQPTTPHYYQPPHSGVNPKYKSTLKPRKTGGAYKVGSFVMGINN